jgi:hypothetical protein
MPTSAIPDERPSMTTPFPLTIDQELAIFERTCERLIADPERLRAVIQRAGITDEHGRLSRDYGGETF